MKINNRKIASIIINNKEIKESKINNKTVFLKNSLVFTKYLTFAVKNSTATVSLSNVQNNELTMYISNDTVNWTPWDGSNITVLANTNLYVHGENPNGFSTSSYSSTFTVSNDFDCSGNIMGLLGENVTDIPNNYCFYNLFKNCSKLVTAPELPATTLADYCYSYMFNGCTSLTTAPELPATTLANRCYRGMFYGCSSLVTAPELPASYVKTECYRDMFYGCSSLVTAPELPASSVNSMGCYQSMFENCTSLTTAPELPATYLGMSCYESMFAGCTSLTTAPELPAFDLTSICYRYMFYGCSSLNYIKCSARYQITSSNLQYWVSGVSSEGTFIKNPYAEWSRGTSGIPAQWVTLPITKYLTFTAESSSVNISLSNIANKAIFTSTDAENWTRWDGTNKVIPVNGHLYVCGENPNGLSTSASDFSMFTMSGGNCYCSGDIMSLLGQNVTTIPCNYCFYELFYNCKNLKSAPELPATIMTSYCYAELFKKTGLTTAPSLPATTLAEFCYKSTFQECENLTASPALPATNLVLGAYREMFYGCTALTTASELPAMTIANDAYYSMYEGCTALTTAPNLPATNLGIDAYYSMFKNCSSLVNVPKVLPATTLARSCYAQLYRGCTSLVKGSEMSATVLAENCCSNMFAGDTNLETAPELPAATLEQGCYNEMFRLCRKIKYIKCLATDISATNATNNWLYGVASVGTFVKALNSTWGSGASGIPTNWSAIYNGDNLIFTALDEDVTLSYSVSGTVISSNFYIGDGNHSTMTQFSSGSTVTIPANKSICIYGNNPNGISTMPGYVDDNCVKFNINKPCKCSGNIMKALISSNATNTIPNEYCFQMMFKDTNLVTAPELPATTLKSWCYSYMFEGCRSLVTAPELPATTLADNCYEGMFYKCSSLVTAPELPATTLTYACYTGMFCDCTNLEIAPLLPATTLVDYCYGGMFLNCTHLHNIKCLAIPISTSDLMNKTGNWVSGVSATGTFYKKAGASWPIDNYYGIPTGWTVVEI